MTIGNPAPIRTLVVGLGNMGLSHALACHADPAFQIVGLVNRSTPDLPKALRGLSLRPRLRTGTGKPAPPIW